MRRREGSRYWIPIVLIAILIHLALLFSVQDSFFGLFRKSIDDAVSSSSPSSPPNAIVAIPVDIEGEEPAPVVIEKHETPPDPIARPSEDPGDNADDLLTRLVDGPQATLPSQPSTEATVIPPRPVEITWPETRKLGHCLGRHVDVRIRVGTDGSILRAEAVPSDLPPDCTRAAVEAARRIVFQPGRANGHPIKMWTKIRIDFRKNP